MQEEDRKAFGTLVATALALWDKDVTASMIRLWWNAMNVKGYAFIEIERAFDVYLMDPERGRFKPMPSDIVRVLEGTGSEHTVAAWAVAYEAAQRVGAYRTVVFDDPAIMATINDMGGWPKLCRTETNELGYLQKRFSDTYRAYRNMPGHPYPKRLTGDVASDEEFERRGLPLPKPVFIGAAPQCQLVMEGGRSSIEFSNVIDAVKLPVVTDAEKNS